jgi:hypothetical protein
MNYSQLDILRRIKATLPTRWFGQNTPILDLVLTSLSSGWVGLFNLLNYVRAQTRISTAFYIWLDIIAKDYFGYRLRRRQSETDSSFRRRICIELLRDRCTRKSVCNLLQDLTGRVPVIFEPTNPRDTGCYGSLTSIGTGMSGYGCFGGWGSLNLPFQVFVRAFRPIAAGVAMVNGWGGAIGAYGTGSCEYVSLGMSSSQAEDGEVYESVRGVAPIGTIIWLSIEP